MTGNDTTSTSAESTGFFDPPAWWHKPLIWGIFVGLIYLLREFFLIGFLTFLICFIVRGLVGFLIQRISPNRENHRLELILTLAVFAGVLVGMYGVGRYFAPQVIRQGKSLASQLRNTTPEEVQNSLLVSTVGSWQFHRQFGLPEDQRYQQAFEQFQESGRQGEGLYRAFPNLNSMLQSEFEATYEQALVQHLKSDPGQSAELETQSNQQWSEFRKSAEYQARFKSFYQNRRRENRDAAPMDYAFFQQLSNAYPKGKEAFMAAVHQHYDSINESLDHQRQDFESATKLELSQKWWGTSHVADWIRDHIKHDGPVAFEGFVGRVEAGMGEFIRVPIQIATALVLAFFMLIEWHGMKTGLASLRDTRLRPIYDEITPGIVALGKLIGKSFQGQVVIAFFNAIFTFVALWVIGVEYKFILALVTFLFSFIPVIGVILTAVPICAVAILQPGGSLLMVVQVLIAIAIIHMMEGMVLSPRIIGKIGHLHPVLVIAILLVAEHFFGMWGLILGVPVAIYLIRVVILNDAIPGVYEPEGVIAEGNPAS